LKELIQQTSLRLFDASNFDPVQVNFHFCRQQSRFNVTNTFSPAVNLNPFPIHPNRRKRETKKPRGEVDGRDLASRYSKLFSALFSDGDFPEERESEGERRRLPHALGLLQIAARVQRTCCLLHSGFKARSVQRSLHLPCLFARIYTPSPRVLSPSPSPPIPFLPGHASP